MDIQRIAAFSTDGQGGNPAGVVLSDHLPDPAKMQEIAAEVGYSETVFAAPEGGKTRARYFAPQAEVPFCGHATIALGAALGESQGQGTYHLVLNDAEIEVTAAYKDGQQMATLLSPPTSHHTPAPELAAAALELFGWATDDIDPKMAMMQANAGAEHLIIPLAKHDLLQGMTYGFDKGASLMQAFGLVTINLVWRQSESVFYARNPFAGHGVYEDPATGAAAAALAGYLRDAGHQESPFEILQGQDMGVPSQLFVEPQKGRGAPIKVSGATRRIVL